MVILILIHVSNGRRHFFVNLNVLNTIYKKKIVINVWIKTKRDFNTENQTQQLIKRDILI